MSESNKKHPLVESLELAQMRAFAEMAVSMWLKRMPAKRVAKPVEGLPIRWSYEGHHISIIAGALHAELAMKFEVDHMLDLIVAREDINGCRYDPAQVKFVKITVKTEGRSHNKSGDRKKFVMEFDKKLAKLEEQVKKADKRAVTSEKGLGPLISHIEVGAGGLRRVRRIVVTGHGSDVVPAPVPGVLTVLRMKHLMMKFFIEENGSLLSEMGLNAF